MCVHAREGGGENHEYFQRNFVFHWLVLCCKFCWLFFFEFCCGDKILHYDQGCSQICNILLFQPPKYWDCRRKPAHLVQRNILKTGFSFLAFSPTLTTFTTIGCQDKVTSYPRLSVSARVHIHTHLFCAFLSRLRNLRNRGTNLSVIRLYLQLFI